MARKTGIAADILAEIGGATFKGDVILTADVGDAEELAKLNNQVTGTITLHNYSQDFTGADAASTEDLIDALKGIKGFKGDLEANTTVTVADIKALKASTKGNLTLSDAALTSKFENVKAADIISAFDDVAGAMTGIITIKETITLAQAEELSDLTTGVVTATIAPATAADLLAATFKATDVLSVTVKGAYTVDDLIALDAATQFAKISLSNKAQALTVDDLDDLVDALTDTGYKGNVKVTDTTAITEVQLIALNDLTTGKITLNAASLADTATYSENAANLVKAFNGITGLKGNVEITDAPTIAQLKAINKATSGAIEVAGDTDLSGSAKDLIEALKDVTFTGTSTVEITGAVTLAQIKELQGTGADVSFTSPTAALTGTTADIIAALDSLPTGYKGAIKITDDAYTADDLVDIQAKTDGKVTLAKLNVELNNNYDNITAALDGIKGYKGAITLVDITNDAPADINDIAKLTTGKLTATLDASTDIEDATVTALKDVNTKDAIIFAATDTSADATAYLALSKLIPTATFAAVATITEDAAQIGTNGKNVIDALNKLNNGDTDVALNGTVSVASVKAINDATTGDLTEVTGLTTIDAQDGKTTNMTIKIADILAANDSTGDFSFNIIGDAKDTVTFDATGWNTTVTEVVGDKQYTFENAGGDVITVNLTNVYDVVLPA